MSAGCRTIHARYFAITSSREPSRPITNGLPHLLGRPRRADGAGPRTPKAPRRGARRNRFCRALAINRRALARSLRSAKSAGPRILGPARSARYDGRSEAREEGGEEWGVPGERETR